MRILNRRALKRFLILSSIGAFSLVILTCVAVAWMLNQAQQSNVGEVAFTNRLSVPPLLEPTMDEHGRKVFDLEVTAGQVELLPGQHTDTWGLNGPHLSPTLRASHGDEVVVNVKNGINEPTTLHWHGMHLPAAMDGGPHQMIEPGATWSPTWTIDQPAASLWFHPHPHGATANHVYQGVAGMFLLDDEESQDLDLPKTYGVDDIPLIIQDMRFNGDGSLNTRAPTMSSVGMLGDTILVNGTYSPYIEATTSLVRFRVLNASLARVYNLGFTDDREFALIGTDSGLLEAPIPVTRLQLSPGERAEIVVEVGAGEEATLRSFPPDLGLDFFSDRVNGGRDRFDLVQIRGAAQLAESAPLPAELVTLDFPEEADAAQTRSLALQGETLINGAKMDMTRIDFAVTRDTTEIWEIRNASGIYHNFHVHDVHFAVLDIDGQPPPSHLRGWKDTIFIPRGSSVRIIAHFADYADPETPFMFHCHILRHEDRGMMGQFVVIEPGTTAPTQVAGSHTAHE